MTHILLTASTITYCQFVLLASVFFFSCCLFCNPNSFFFPTGTCRQSADIFDGRPKWKNAKYFLIPQMGHLTPPEKYHKQFGLLSLAKGRQPGFVWHCLQRREKTQCLIWIILNSLRSFVFWVRGLRGTAQTLCTYSVRLVVGKFLSAFYFGVDLKISMRSVYCGSWKGSKEPKDLWIWKIILEYCSQKINNQNKGLFVLLCTIYKHVRHCLYNLYKCEKM